MNQDNPTIGKIRDHAATLGYRITLTQAREIRDQLGDPENWTGTQGHRSLKLMHTSNVVAAAVAGVAELGPPVGFEVDDADNWWWPDEDGVIERWWTRPIEHASPAGMTIVVVDRIINGRIIRQAPRLNVKLTSSLAVDEAHTVVDGLQVALRELVTHEADAT
ncbi:hypothetical protein [Rhodococcus pyridinivorans]|uniref:hypothetical protein n=1 Tax=Rhodococcus pyridinivorans TaxID=103816 RepID=UPI00110EDC2E|nr:hypothetical protein [Rhodococcus pyridinivorans]